MEEQYLEAFIRETEEEIPKLNNSLLELEADPGSTAAMDQIFRTAHTLKGNFGALGFENGAALAHAMEDLLDAMREGELAVTSELMDLVFAAVDELERIVEQIDAEGEPSIDTDETVTQLRDALESTGEETATRETCESQTQPATGLEIDPVDVEGRAVFATVALGETEMPGVDAMIVLEAVEEAFTLVDTVPERAEIEDGEFEGAFELVLDAPDSATVEAELAAMSQLETATVEDVTADLVGVNGDGSERGDGDGRDGRESRKTGGADGETGADSKRGDEGDASESQGAGGGDGESAPTPPEHESAARPNGQRSGSEIRSVRVDVDRLDELYGMVEQLVTSRITLRRGVEEERLESANETLKDLDKITETLQNTVMEMRLIPFEKVVGKFPRMVRDLARELEKEVTFELEGEDVELDRTILTELSDPLLHIIRNALDHGIEPPDERERGRKPRQGTLRVSASRERDHVTIEISDDGRGLDPDALRQTAAERGLRSPEALEAMPDSEVYDLIFHPGFSTAEEVTDTSGRGVGMDVVYNTVTRLDGSVDVDSAPGEGMTVSLRLPVTMAIVKVLFVEVGEETYGVPVKHVDEITSADDVTSLEGQAVIRHDDGIYPVVDLAERFNVPRAATNGGTPDGMLVRIRASERQVALRCDAVTDQEEVVVKPLEGVLGATPGLSGTAVVGDSEIVYIVDLVTV